MEIRPAIISDAAGINEIGNYYITNSPANFKLEELTLSERESWMMDFSETGRHQLLVGVDGETVWGIQISLLALPSRIRDFLMTLFGR